MSFQISTTNVTATVLLPGFQARCTLPVVGLIQTFLNDDQKEVFSLQAVTLHGLEVGNPAASTNLEELHVCKDQCEVIAFEVDFPQEQMGLLPRSEQVAVYTSHFAIRGNFYMGMDAHISDFIVNTRSLYIGVTDAYIFPLFKTQKTVVRHAPLAYIYRTAVRMHHAL